MSVSLLLSHFHYVLESAEALRLVEPPRALVVAVYLKLHALHCSTGGLRSDPVHQQTPDSLPAVRVGHCHLVDHERAARVAERILLSDPFAHQRVPDANALDAGHDHLSTSARHEQTLGFQGRRPVERLEPIREPMSVLLMHLPEKIDDLVRIIARVNRDTLNSGHYRLDSMMSWKRAKPCAS